MGWKMALIDFLKNIYLQSKITLMDYDNDIILINKDFAFTLRGNITKKFKEYTTRNIMFILAENKNEFKIYIK